MQVIVKVLGGKNKYVLMQNLKLMKKLRQILIKQQFDITVMRLFMNIIMSLKARGQFQADLGLTENDPGWIQHQNR